MTGPETRPVLQNAFGPTGTPSLRPTCAILSVPCLCAALQRSRGQASGDGWRRATFLEVGIRCPVSGRGRKGAGVAAGAPVPAPPLPLLHARPAPRAPAPGRLHWPRQERRVPPVHLHSFLYPSGLRLNVTCSKEPAPTPKAGLPATLCWSTWTLSNLSQLIAATCSLVCLPF